ncbi:MAG: hypothetical protein HN353_11105 [Bdellovibrionales bacterium]|jgi:hypothetical protein|nr:hypothetical protein [Bdellovibrionales bacterium]MBT3525183.1 hypothetical protein [Bdellovibrionales bacterium]MBT7670427.1 hypothetical protein [Bdellovibrionales bacterium]MBT7766204.1 hypothetical protein [Bdellovibrionales bacterium]
MRALLIVTALLSTLCLSAVASASALHLNRSTIEIGTLDQDGNNPAQTELLVLRSSKTPKRVDLSMNYRYLANVCKEWEVRRTWIPGTVVCTPTGPNGEVTCHTTGGRWEEERVCVRWAREEAIRYRKVKLKFKNAARLRGDEQETFNISIYQESYDRSSIDLSGEVVDSATDYYIKEVNSAFTRHGLVFYKK